MKKINFKSVFTIVSLTAAVFSSAAYAELPASSVIFNRDNVVYKINVDKYTQCFVTTVAHAEVKGQTYVPAPGAPSPSIFCMPKPAQQIEDEAKR